MMVYLVFLTSMLVCGGALSLPLSHLRTMRGLNHHYKNGQNMCLIQLLRDVDHPGNEAHDLESRDYVGLFGGGGGGGDGDTSGGLWGDNWKRSGLNSKFKKKEAAHNLNSKRFVDLMGDIVGKPATNSQNSGSKRGNWESKRTNDDDDDNERALRSQNSGSGWDEWDEWDNIKHQDTSSEDYYGEDLYLDYSGDNK